MKKIFYFIAALLATSIGMISCSDNEDYSKVHVLTNDEIAEMHRQDSIDSVNRARINADFIYQYSIDITISANSYDGGFLEIDYPKMAADFGISETELLHGIANMRAEYLEQPYADAAKISGFAIEGSTHNDNMTAYNTNGIWGHWWDENGDVTAWGDNARVYLEYYEPEEDGDPIGFNVGQMPGTLVNGQQVVVHECLKYQDLRMCLEITVNAKDREEVKANIVYEEDVNVELTPNDAGDYTPNPVPFDLAAVLSATGLSELSPANLVTYNAEGAFWDELNADNGFWFDKTGPIGSWGNDASCWISYGVTDDPATIGVTLMPNATAAGEHYDHDFGFVNNGKIAMLHVHVDVVGFQDDEKRPEGEPTTTQTAITMSKPFTSGYETVQYDVREILRNTFKLTTYEIFQAKANGDLKIYINEANPAEDPAYSADAPGYWMSADGENVGWGDGIFWVSLGGNEKELYLYGGNHPGNADPAGQTCHTKYIITCNGGQAEFDITFVIESNGGPTPDQVAAAEVINVGNVEASFPVSATEYAGANVEFDYEAVKAALGVSSMTEIGCVAAMGPDGKFTNKNTADANCGFWYDRDGKVINYGEEAVMFINYYGWDADNNVEYPEDEYTLYTGQMPGALAVGDTVTMPFGFYADGKIAVLNVTLTAAEAQEPVDMAPARKARHAYKK